MRKTLVLLVGLAILVIANVGIVARERLLREGRVVLLPLAPVDPRSLMQGDFMALNFAVANALPPSVRHDGAMILQLDEHAVGRFLRLDDGRVLAANEQRLHYRVRGKRVRLVSDAWFFEEGQAAVYAPARYGEFRVAADGEALLAGLRDGNYQPLGR